MFEIFWVVFKLAGLAPWKINKRGDFRYSWWSILTGYGLMTSAVAHYTYSNIKELEQARVRENWKNSATARVVGYIDFGTMCVTSVLCLVAATKQAKNIFRIVEEFQVLKSFHKIPTSPLRFRHTILVGLLMASLVIYDLTTGGLAVCEPLIGAWYLRFFLYGSELVFTSAVLTLYELFRNANNRLRSSAQSKSTDTHHALQVLPFVDFIRGDRAFNIINKIYVVSRTLLSFGDSRGENS